MDKIDQTPLNLSDMRQLASNVVKGIPDSLLHRDAKYWNSHTKELHKAIAKALQRTLFSIEYFPLKMNYTYDTEILLKAGSYYSISSGINSRNFPTDGKGIVQLNAHLVKFGEEFDTCDIVRILGTEGLRPADNHELLTFGIEYPQKQEQFQIVQLKQSSRNRIRSGRDYERETSRTCLKPTDGERTASIIVHGDWDKWDIDTRFLFFEK